MSEAEAITASVSVPSRLSFKVAVREPAFQVVGSRLPSDFGALWAVLRPARLVDLPDLMPYASPTRSAGCRSRSPTASPDDGVRSDEPSLPVSQLVAGDHSMASSLRRISLYPELLPLINGLERTRGATAMSLLWTHGCTPGIVQCSLLLIL